MSVNISQCGSYFVPMVVCDMSLV